MEGEWTEDCREKYKLMLDDEILSGAKFVFTKQPIKRRVVHATSRTEVINQH